MTFVHLWQYLTDFFLEGEKNYRENRNLYSMFNNFLFSEICEVCQIRWKKFGRPGQATDDNIIGRMLLACWITKTTDIHSEYVTLLFHCHNSYANAPQSYLIRKLPLFFPSSFLSRFLYAFLFFLKLTTCSSHSIFLDLITRIIFGEWLIIVKSFFTWLPNTSYLSVRMCSSAPGYDPAISEKQSYVSIKKQQADDNLCTCLNIYIC